MFLFYQTFISVAETHEILWNTMSTTTSVEEEHWTYSGFFDTQDFQEHMLQHFGDISTCDMSTCDISTCDMCTCGSNLPVDYTLPDQRSLFILKLGVKQNYFKSSSQNKILKS